MYALIISLLSSLAVGFYIKYLKIKNIKDLFLFVFANYIVAIVLTFVLFNAQINTTNIIKAFSVNTVVLGMLMPTIFYILNKSLQLSGLAKTDIFQRMSLIIPVLLSFFIFNEIFTWNKLVAIALSFISIVLLLYKKSTKDGKFNIIYLLAVFIGYGIIDTLFKILATNKTIPYIVSLFVIFIICGFVSLLYLLFSKGSAHFKNFLYGTLLGLLNFSNIYFYMKAHKIFFETPTLVFITMNLGVIIGGTFIGKFYFKEKISKSALIGIFTAIISVVLLALIQLHIL
ncbi:EamA family transporter [Paenimyroides aestuarii]|uniref:EamA/RhaT family transporter n=1 Tax=Paenimyroides aestuarii TaxID=2968490 RepID=A0ABY5NRA8_9FLAO|nr:EamA family transporter [Paenimyroides aestuarii]UUV21071.1 EamA/RhaT family transporter [Paenimyroides aestuarii]